MSFGEAGIIPEFRLRSLGGELGGSTVTAGENGLGEMGPNDSGRSRIGGTRDGLSDGGSVRLGVGIRRLPGAGSALKLSPFAMAVLLSISNFGFGEVGLAGALGGFKVDFAICSK